MHARSRVRSAAKSRDFVEKPTKSHGNRHHDGMGTTDIILVGLMASLVIAMGGLFGMLIFGFRRPAE